MKYWAVSVSANIQKNSECPKGWDVSHALRSHAPASLSMSARFSGKIGSEAVASSAAENQRCAVMTLCSTSVH